MLKEVRFMGVWEAQQVEPNQTIVVISILDQFEEHNRPTRLKEFRDNLVLSFVDTSEEPGEPHWPDQMSEADHRAACTWDEDRAPELVDAQRILAFVNKHHSAAETLSLVVHCHGGVSRSAAVAQWVCERLKVSMPQLGDGIHSLEGANLRVLRMLDKATAV